MTLIAISAIVTIAVRSVGMLSLSGNTRDSRAQATRPTDAAGSGPSSRRWADAMRSSGTPPGSMSRSSAIPLDSASVTIAQRSSAKCSPSGAISASLPRSRR